jgi:predicted Ser/Thr protein kinase
MAQPRAASARTGPRIGRYLITGRIGRGGMGMVYRGLDEALEREVAIKTLVAEGSFDPESRRRFEIEARAAAKLAHPNIVTVHELGEDRGILFIAMEMLPGVDLDRLMKSGEALPLAEKLDIVAQICRGLAFAHERGIVHRDVKPSNVRLLDDGTAKIMDFGIAKLGSSHHITKTGMMVGTVHYMSPEQVRAQALDGRTDVFSAGVILYELLAGERPFKGDDVTQILYKIVNEPSPVPDLSACGELAEHLAATVARALAKDPAERFTSAAAFADELRGLHDRVLRAQAPPAASLIEGLAAARRAQREGRLEEALARLRGLVAEHPDAVEVRRALRAAQREHDQRQQPLGPSDGAYPELESTFQAARTRQDQGGEATVDGRAPTELAPTVVAPSSAPAGSAAPEGAVVPARSVWIWAAGAFVVVAALASAVLWRGAPAAPPPVSPTPATAPTPAPGVAEAGTAGPARAAQHMLKVRSEPAGATVSLDGGAAVGVTPLELGFDPASEHRVTVSLAGHVPQEIRTRPGAPPAAIDVALEKAMPGGRVLLESPYALDVVFRGRTLARGETAARVELPGGRQQLTLVAPSVFLKAELSVEVPPGGELTLQAPALGRLNVRATPDNCEVFVGETFVDYPPILDKPIAAGRHELEFRWPDGARVREVVEVKAGAPAFVVGRKP